MGPQAAAATPMASVLDLGGRRHDLTHRALVMGILNRTPDSFYDKGATFALDKLWARAEQLVADGADILDIGGVKAGPGPEVTEAEELDRVVPVVTGLVARFDTPVSVDTWRAAVARACYAQGAVMGNDISGLGDPDYAPAAAEHGAAVVITHIRLKPRVADPDPHYDDVVRDVARFLTERPPRIRVPPACRRSASCSMPASTWARRPSSRSACCAPRRSWPVWATRSCCRPRTRPSWAPSWVSSSPSVVRPPSARRRSASRGGVGSCASTTSRAPAGSVTRWPPSARPREGDRAVSTKAVAPAYLVKGDDVSLVAQEVRTLLAELVGERDHALVVEDIGGGPGDELSVGAVVDACLTPPFLIDRRVVVVRDAGRLVAADAPRLVEVVENPLPGTVLVLVGGGGAVPAALTKAMTAHGHVIDVTTSKAGERKAWLHEHLRGAPVRLARRRPSSWPPTWARTWDGSKVCSGP